MKYERPVIAIRPFYSEEPIAAGTLEDYLAEHSIQSDAPIASYEVTSLAD